MRTLWISLFALTLSFPVLAAEGKKAVVFGKGVQLASAPLSLKEAARQPSKDKEVVVRAKIGQVCQSKGCWLMLEEGELQVRVTFVDYSFFVPKDSGKKMALVQGKLFEKEISASEARHYAKDEGLPESQVSKIKAPQKSLWMEASGVKLL